MTKVMLKDAPGGPELINRLVAVAKDLSLAFAGEDDRAVSATLEQMRIRLTSKLAKEIGAKAAAEVADALVKAVRGRRAEIGIGGRGMA